MFAGDETALAKKLRVPVAAVVDWVLGEVPVPADIFLRAVDVIATLQQQRTAAVAEHTKAVEDFLAAMRKRYG
jgi:hypothetical protein